LKLREPGVIDNPLAELSVVTVNVTGRGAPDPQTGLAATIEPL